MAMRRAQLEQLGGGKLAAGLGSTRLAKASQSSLALERQDLGSEEEEQFTLELLSWLSRFAEEPEFQEPENAGLCVEWLLSQRPGALFHILFNPFPLCRGALDPKFSLVLSGNPRAPKKVFAAAKRDAASLELERLQQSGQRFLANPANIKGFVKRGVMAPFGAPENNSWVPEKLRNMMPEGSLLREQAFPPNSWQGDEYEPCDMEESNTFQLHFISFHDISRVFKASRC